MAGIFAACATSPESPPSKPLSELLAAAPPGDWRRLDPDNTIYMDLPSGRVVIELAPGFAPEHVANIKTLVRQKYFDGLAIVRAHDNYVAQWADPDDKREFGAARKKLAPEFTRPVGGLAFDALPDRDTYAPEAGFSSGFPVARDPVKGIAWMVHCYGTVGVRTPIRQLRIEGDLPEREHLRLEVLRTDTATFRQVVEGRRFRRDAWYKEPAGAVDVRNTLPPVRSAK